MQELPACPPPACACFPAGRAPAAAPASGLVHMPSAARTILAAGGRDRAQGAGHTLQGAYSGGPPLPAFGTKGQGRGRERAGGLPCGCHARMGGPSPALETAWPSGRSQRPGCTTRISCWPRVVQWHADAALPPSRPLTAMHDTEAVQLAAQAAGRGTRPHHATVSAARRAAAQRRPCQRQRQRGRGPGRGRKAVGEPRQGGGAAGVRGRGHAGRGGQEARRGARKDV